MSDSKCLPLLIASLLSVVLVVGGCNLSTVNTPPIFKLLFSPSTEIDKMLVNYAHPDRGSVMTVSKKNQRKTQL
ncbi:MAG TPA: hypothetical protein EYG65_14725 [Rhodospirillales bacterium]|nr:hypothetical protein [Rhodospirillales bacterium]